MLKIDLHIKLLLIPLIFLITGCDYPVPEPTLRYDFLKNFDKAIIYPGRDKVFRYPSWMKQTEGRDAMVIGVFGEATFKLNPEEIGDELYFGFRLRIPDTASAKCVITVYENDSSNVVFSKILEAQGRESDKLWKDEVVNFSHFKNKRVSVKFSVEYEGTDAWVEWSSPILISDGK